MRSSPSLLPSSLKTSAEEVFPFVGRGSSLFRGTAVHSRGIDATARDEDLDVCLPKPLLHTLRDGLLSDLASRISDLLLAALCIRQLLRMFPLSRFVLCFHSKCLHTTFCDILKEVIDAKYIYSSLVMELLVLVIGWKGFLYYGIVSEVLS